VSGQDVSEDGRHVGLGEADRQPGSADAGLVAGRKGEGGAQLGCGRWSCRLQDAFGALNGAAFVQHLLSRVVGVQDSAAFVGQHDGAAEYIEGFGHARALDGADIEHFADRHGAPQMRQQKLSKFYLALGDDALPFVPAKTEAGPMRWRAHQEEHHHVDYASRLYPLLKIGRRFDLRSGKMARDHMWLVQRGPGHLAQYGVDLR
jgi:hypothetical protein